jgi:hypothetical protein
MSDDSHLTSDKSHLALDNSYLSAVEAGRAVGGVGFQDTGCSGKRVDQSFYLFREIIEVGRDA